MAYIVNRDCLDDISSVVMGERMKRKRSTEKYQLGIVAHPHTPILAYLFKNTNTTPRGVLKTSTLRGPAFNMVAASGF